MANTNNALFGFQSEGARWLASRRHALLADEMGLGKTVQAIVAADQVRARRVLVVCPAVAKANWVREWERWGAGRAAVRVESFEGATRLAQATTLRELDLLIIDEVHYAKSREAKRSKALFGVGGLAHRAKRVWCLSGTPAPNAFASELWILLYTFGLTKLRYHDFVEYFCQTMPTPYGEGFKIVGTKRAKIPELKTLLSRLMLRRMKSEVLSELPPIFFSQMEVEPGDVDLAEEFADLAERLEIEQGLVLRALSSREQVAMLEGLAGSVSTLRRYTGLQKVEPCAELVASEIDMELYSKIGIFCIHTRVVRELAARLAAYGVVTITGDTPLGKRMEAQDRFQTDPSVRVFIGNQAAHTNLTLTAAHHAIILEPDWVPGNNLQAAMRFHRIGQREAVNVRFLCLDNHIDSRVTEVLRRKTKELAEIFDF